MLRKILFAYMLFYSAQLFSVRDVLFNQQTSIIKPGRVVDFSITMLTNLLSTELYKDFSMIFLLLLSLFALTGLFGMMPRISSLVVFFMAVNLQNRIYATTTGGDILAYLLLFYLSFVSNGKKLKNPNFNQIQNASNKVFIFLCYFQVIVVYAVSGIYKLMSPEWLNGEALYYILSVNEYSLPFIQQNINSLTGVLKVCTWLALLYQVLFPILVFNKRIKNYFLLGGIIFHVGIGLVMGLLNFSLVMLCCYALFAEFKTKGRKLPLAKLSESH